MIGLPSSSPVKDAALSRPKLGFKSRREHLKILGIKSASILIEVWHQLAIQYEKLLERKI